MLCKVDSIGELKRRTTAVVRAVREEKSKNRTDNTVLRPKFMKEVEAGHNENVLD